ncbi:hypothetical protein ELQ88_16375 [Pseudomonas sp. MPC6]|nr:hypothetical protein ELQ88_16375 [Pseudomonas sp. MPC6]
MIIFAFWCGCVVNRCLPYTCSKPKTCIDSHAHVFSRELNLTAARRYTPRTWRIWCSMCQHRK